MATTTRKEKVSDVTRQRVLDAAARVLAGYGYFGTRLEDIAAAAGIKAGSMYYYFSSREELIDEVLTIATARINRAVRASVKELPESLPYIEKIRVALRTHIKLALGDDYYSAASLRIEAQMPMLLRRRYIVLEREYGNFWKRLLEGARKAGEIDHSFNLSVVRLLVLGAANWTIEWYKPGGELNPEQIADQLTNALFLGIAHGTAQSGRSAFLGPPAT